MDVYCGKGDRFLGPESLCSYVCPVAGFRGIRTNTRLGELLNVKEVALFGKKQLLIRPDRC